MSRDQELFERRRTPRITPRGAVIVHGASRPLLGRIRNLGIGGVFVDVEAGSHELIPALAQHVVEVELRVEDVGAGALELRGTVIRTTPDTLVVRFAQSTPELEAVVRADLSAAELADDALVVALDATDDGSR